MAGVRTPRGSRRANLQRSLLLEQGMVLAFLGVAALRLPAAAQEAPGRAWIPRAHMTVGQPGAFLFAARLF
jgi:hypothetical protein